MPPRSLWAVAMVTCASLAATPPARAAEAELQEYVFRLANGGELVGRWVNRDDAPRENYKIRLSFGGQITLDKDQVATVSKRRAVEAEYEELRPKFADTVDGQWQAAQWCQANQLNAARKTHLQRIIELDPDHKDARRHLGYQLDVERRRWVTQEDLMEERGYVRFGNEWVLPQEVQLREIRRKNELAEKQWFSRVRRMREDVDKPKKHAQAIEELKAIEDPYAIKAIAYYIDPKRENLAEMRKLFVEILGRIGDGAVHGILIDRALYDVDEEVRLTAIDMLAMLKSRAALAEFIKQLGSGENAVINRAAIGLASLNDKSAVGPLIDALISTHVYVRKSGGSGQVTSSFGTNGGGGSLMSGPRVQTFKRTFKNESVLHALAKISGVNFGYAVDQWKTWLATQKKSEAIDARRD